MLNKILIANRGEIAVRIIKTARELGIATVAVFSDADSDAIHVRLADEAFHIGPSPAPQSYLDIGKIIAVARESGADAIHPGYGFLSENADFSAACSAAGIEFIGPPADVIRLMGSKRAAKSLMAEHGVPVVPGYFGDASDEELGEKAAAIGFPVLIKASAGGGGRGMRLVRAGGEFAGALLSARREAKAAFGDDTVLLEKYVERPRHVEVQIFGDKHGNVVHLFERDCSVQRRYQKLIEEAPATHLTDEQRDVMLEAAITAGRAANYVGAGTVEFVVDASGGVYFIEMNTRLQVEHPVTEMITGEDLVAWQLKVASGGTLPPQSAITQTGHAFELRLCAEDADREFAPSTGVITHFAVPAAIRVDHGMEAGLAISPHYDSMIAKVIVHGEDRGAALHRARRALADVEVAGVTTNRAFLDRILAHPDFAESDVDTHFIEEHLSTLLPTPGAANAMGLALAALHRVASRHLGQTDAGEPYSPWTRGDAFRVNLCHQETLNFAVGENDYPVTVEHHRGHYRVSCPDLLDALRCEVLAVDTQTLSARLGHERLEARVVYGDAFVDVFAAAEHHRFAFDDPLLRAQSNQAAAGGLAAPMPGTVLEVFVTEGQVVTKGTPLLLIEAMKIEHTITAPFDGTVTELRFEAGEQIAAEGVQLVVMEAS